VTAREGKGELPGSARILLTRSSEGAYIPAVVRGFRAHRAVRNFLSGDSATGCATRRSGARPVCVLRESANLARIGEAEFMPKTFPAYVRWGVGNDPAVELMSRGLTSRTLAMRVATKWLSENKPSGNIISWLRALSIIQWQELLLVSITEVRLLLEFYRDQMGGVAVDLINNSTASLLVDSFVSEFQPTEVSVLSTEKDDITFLEIFASDQLVGRVQSKDQSDVQSILSFGLDFKALFSAKSGLGNLKIDLINPEA
jgi:hypothetical protein